MVTAPVMVLNFQRQLSPVKSALKRGLRIVRLAEEGFGLLGIEQGGVRNAVEPQVFVFLVDGDGSVAGIPQVDFFDEEGLQGDDAQVFASGGELVDGVDDSRVEALAQIRVGLATFFDVRSFNDEKI
jgi:hypothetical protein